MYGCLHYRAELYVRTALCGRYSSVRTALRGRYYVYPLQRLSAIVIKRRYYYYYYYYYVCCECLKCCLVVSGVQVRSDDGRQIRFHHCILQSSFHAVAQDIRHAVREQPGSCHFRRNVSVNKSRK